MVRLLTFSFAALVLLGGCKSQEKFACKRFAEVCTELKVSPRHAVIVSLNVKADQQAFLQFLQQHDITLDAQLEVTSQMIVEVDFDEFIVISQNEAVDSIKLDTFYPR